MCLKFRKTNRDRNVVCCDIRDYNEVDLVNHSEGNTPVQVPFLFGLHDVANNTDLCPVLCGAYG